MGFKPNPTPPTAQRHLSCTLYNLTTSLHCTHHYSRCPLNPFFPSTLKVQLPRVGGHKFCNRLPPTNAVSTDFCPQSRAATETVSEACPPVPDLYCCLFVSEMVRISQVHALQSICRDIPVTLYACRISDSTLISTASRFPPLIDRRSNSKIPKTGSPSRRTRPRHSSHCSSI